jgi:hypothetical protein
VHVTNGVAAEDLAVWKVIVALLIGCATYMTDPGDTGMAAGNRAAVFAFVVLCVLWFVELGVAARARRQARVAA